MKIRIKLGQTLFPTPKCPQMCDSQKLLLSDCSDCENCKYEKWYCELWKKEGHLRFNFDAQDNFQQNKDIIDLFEDLYEDKKVVVHAVKGGLTVYVVLNSYYEPSYWNSYREDLLHYENKYNYCGEGTVEIIQDIIYQMRSI